MDDSIFARLGYDPVRIHAHFHGPPAPGGIARLGGPAPTVEVKGDPEPAGEPPDPPPEGEGDHLKGGGGAPAGDPGLEGSEQPDVPLHQASATGAPARPAPAEDLPPAGPSSRLRPPPRSGEDQEEDAADEAYSIYDWLVEFGAEVDALVKARQAPVAPLPPEPPPAPIDRADLPRPYVAHGDRWTKPKMAEFLRQLAATHSVTAAARAVGMSRRSAYKLRARLKGQPFDIAWEAAFRHGYDELAHAALELALEGEEVPHYYQGELKATHRKRNPQLMVQLLKMRNREGAPMLGRYNAAAEFYSENWERITHRVETGSVTWDDERRALGEEELKRLDLGDEARKVDQLIQRNLPDEPKRRSGG